MNYPTWSQRNALRNEIEKLPSCALSRLNNGYDSCNRLYLYSDIENKLIELVALVKKSIGKESYAKLAEIMRETNAFLLNPHFPEKYEKLAKKYQGNRSIILQSLGACMLGLAAVVAVACVIVSMPITATVTTASLALVGLGIFAIGRSVKSDFSKKMHQIVSEVKIHNRDLRRDDLHFAFGCHTPDCKWEPPRQGLYQERLRQEQKDLTEKKMPIPSDIKDGETLVLGRIYPVVS